MNFSARALAAVAMLSGLVACGRSKTSSTDAQIRPVSIHVETVRRVPSAGRHEVAGVVAARTSGRLTARSAASVLRVLVHEGERVHKGTRLVDLDSRDVRARLSAATAAEKTAAAESARTEALAREGAATEQERDATAAALSSAEASRREVEVALSYLKIDSPFDGTVTSVSVHDGDLVMPGSELAVVESLDGLEVRAEVGAESSGNLKEGDILPARIDGIAEPVNVKIRAISPAGDEQTHRFLVRADVPAATRARSGLFARLLLPPGDDETDLTVPASAILQSGGLTGVFVIREGKAWLTWIATGATSRDRTAVRSGLEEGEQIASRPDNLSDGVPVEIER